MSQGFSFRGGLLSLDTLPPWQREKNDETSKNDPILENANAGKSSGLILRAFRLEREV